ncbi:MAG: MotA/TolQ/ExbB proton channel family protein, partial [Phycisphaerales bacterium]|nr:MotA/TolQ/ExbB proton channel family protein [Phycisphaerales bacterium]
MPESDFGLWDLFWQSRDVFTLLLILGSVLGVTIIVRSFLEIRASTLLPRRVIDQCRESARQGRLEDLSRACSRDDAFIGPVVRATLEHETDEARREAAELVASERCAHLFRRIELLNVIGNLGPLIGLAGTVWGMILAFATLGEAGGQAEPADLSLGISKALFHTMLGLCLAIPCLFVHSILRARVDQIC